VGGREEKVGERGGREREAGESGREEMERGPEEEGGRVSSAQLKCGGRFTEWFIEPYITSVDATVPPQKENYVPNDEVRSSFNRSVLHLE